MWLYRYRLKHFHLEVGNFVAAIYEEDLKPYIGKIVQTDDADIGPCHFHGNIYVNYQPSFNVQVAQK